MKLIYNRFIQVAGIIDNEEAKLLIDCGIKYLGIPLRLPVNKEDLSDSDAAQLIASYKSEVNFILITYLNSADEILEFCALLDVKIVQLHGYISLDELLELKNHNTDLEIIKSLIVRENNVEMLLKTIEDYSPLVDAFITDTFDPQTGATGATGKTHNWGISQKIVESSEKPIILAGGLNPSNVKEAILRVKPAGVDVHSGVEDLYGRKDKNLVQGFIQNANNAFSIIDI